MRFLLLPCSACGWPVSLAANPPSDDEIYDKVRITLANDKDVKGGAIEVKVTHGVGTFRYRAAGETAFEGGEGGKEGEGRSEGNQSEGLAGLDHLLNLFVLKHHPRILERAEELLFTASGYFVFPGFRAKALEVIVLIESVLGMQRGWIDHLRFGGVQNDSIDDLDEAFRTVRFFALLIESASGM